MIYSWRNSGSTVKCGKYLEDICENWQSICDTETESWRKIRITMQTIFHFSPNRYSRFLDNCDYETRERN